MPRAYLRQMARLLQLHKELHPRRIAERYGVTDEDVRGLLEKYQPDQMAPVSEALATFYGERRG